MFVCFCLMACQNSWVIWYQSHPCRRTVVVLFSSKLGAGSESSYFSQLYEPESQLNRVTGVRTRLRRCWCAARQSLLHGDFSFLPGICGSIDWLIGFNSISTNQKLHNAFTIENWVIRSFVYLVTNNFQTDLYFILNLFFFLIFYFLHTVI